MIGLGLAGLLIYLGLAFGIIPGPDRLVISLAFLIAPLAIIGMVSLYRRLREQNDSVCLASGFVLLVSAFILFHLMIVVQQALFWFRDQAIASAADDAVRTQIRTVYGAVNGVQLGADIAFDVFYCLGILFVCSVMYRDPRFGRVISVFGILSSGALLYLNLLTFPNPPAESGLIDLGPLTGIWWLAVIGLLARKRRPGPEVQPAG